MDPKHKKFVTTIERSLGVTNATPARSARLAEAIAGAGSDGTTEQLRTGLLHNGMPGFFEQLKVVMMPSEDDQEDGQ